MILLVWEPPLPLKVFVISGDYPLGFALRA